MENIQAIAVIVGLVNGARLLEVNRKGFYYFLGAVVAGVVFGAFHFFGLTIETGIVSALAGSGLYRVAQKVGGSE
jgi:hypothetical protein